MKDKVEHDIAITTDWTRAFLKMDLPREIEFLLWESIWARIIQGKEINQA